MEFIVRDDGLLTEKSVQELAAWYADGGRDPETFEGHLLLLRAYPALISSAQRGRRTNLSMERYGLLRLLHRAPHKRLLLSEVSEALGVSPSSITKLVNGLVRLGLVQRLSNPADKRRAWAQITPAGERLVLENMPRVRASTRARWHGLNQEEKRVLVHLLSKLILSVQSASAAERLRLVQSEAAAGRKDRRSRSAS